MMALSFSHALTRPPAGVVVSFQMVDYGQPGAGAGGEEEEGEEAGSKGAAGQEGPQGPRGFRLSLLWLLEGGSQVRVGWWLADG